MELLSNFFFHYTDNVRYLKANSRRKCIIVKSARAGLETRSVTHQELSRGQRVWMLGRALLSPTDHEEASHMVCRGKAVFRS